MVAKKKGGFVFISEAHTDFIGILFESVTFILIVSLVVMTSMIVMGKIKVKCKCNSGDDDTIDQ